jgi:hypothetical protein
MSDIDRLQAMINELRRQRNSCEPKTNQNPATSDTPTPSPFFSGSSMISRPRALYNAEHANRGR